MKMLFAAALVCLVPLLPLATSAPAKKGAAKAGAAKPEPTPEPTPLPRKPGFWERAWDGTKSGSKKAWNATARKVTKPFRSKGEAGPAAGWNNLAMSITHDPVSIKVPDTKSIRVKVAVTNQGKHGVQLDFPTTQRVDILLKDDAGRVLAKASDEQKVDEEQGFIVINPYERLEYTATLPTRGLSPGQNYTIEALFPNYPQLSSQHPVMPVR